MKKFSKFFEGLISKMIGIIKEAMENYIICLRVFLISSLSNYICINDIKKYILLV